ncbi:MAG: transcriptional repressor [Synergistaceae bacterium]|nr:transcriptional repressor [Synergistaceae bacterium]
MAQINDGQAAGLLRRYGIRVTKSRTDILRFLIEASRPLSHAEIQEALPELDRVTLYRALSFFVEHEAAHQVQGPDGAWRFCAHSPNQDICPGNHPHFLCSSCGKMICLSDQRLARVDVPEGCEVEGKQFVVYGKCADCAGVIF